MYAIFCDLNFYCTLYYIIMISYCQLTEIIKVCYLRFSSNQLITHNFMDKLCVNLL